MLGIVATLMLGCTGTETTTPEPEPVVEPEPAPEPEPEPEPVADEAITPAALNADRDARVGKEVTVKGFYSNMTKQEEPAQINVPVYEDAELAGDSVLCVFDVAKETELAGLTEKAEITVKGTVSQEKFLEKTRLDNCALAPAAEGGEEGKAGKQKAGDGEGKGGKRKAKGAKGDH